MTTYGLSPSQPTNWTSSGRGPFCRTSTTTSSPLPPAGSTGTMKRPSMAAMSYARSLAGAAQDPAAGFDQKPACLGSLTAANSQWRNGGAPRIPSGSDTDPGNGRVDACKGQSVGAGVPDDAGWRATELAEGFKYARVSRPMPGRRGGNKRYAKLERQTKGGAIEAYYKHPNSR